MIFDDQTIQKLKNLSLVAARIRSGQVKGERRSLRKGTSIEFADYRTYSPGDDLRRVDWNIYARLDRPFVKLFEEEEDLAVHLLLDASGSMDWGLGNTNKFQFALRLGGGLGLIAINKNDQLTFSLIAGEEVIHQLGPLRGRGNLPRLLKFLEGQKPNGDTNLNEALQNYSRKPGRAGLAIVISDLFSPQGYSHGIRALQKKGYEVIVIQVHSPDELQPAFSGDIRLVDRETSQVQEVTMTPGLHRLYQERLQAWHQEIKTNLRALGVHFFTLETSTNWDRFILNDLRQAGLIR
jgi:uncharacterized protein (DUF58 family)